MFKKTIKLIFILLIFCYYFISVCDNKIYQTIGNLILSSEELIQSSISLANNHKTAFEHGGNISLVLNDFEKKQIFFKLGSFKGDFKNDALVFKNYSLYELNILAGAEESPLSSIYKNIDRTETSVGSAILATMLSCPLTDSAKILNRQRLIKFLLYNEEVFNHLNNLILKIKSIENSILNYWNSRAELDQAIEKMFYESKGSSLGCLNKSSLYHQLNHLCSLTRVGLSFAMVFGTPLIYMPLMIKRDKRLIPNEVWNSELKYKYRAWGKGILASLFGEMMLFFYARPVLENYKIRKLVLNGLHKRVTDLKCFINIVESIKVLRERHAELFKVLNLNNSKQNFIWDQEKSMKNLSVLQQHLKNPLFEKEFSIISYVGDILAAYDYMREIKDDFIPSLESYGEIDAYLSMVKLLQEYEKKRLSYCFVDFVNYKQPIIDLVGVWNPLIDVTVAKPIDITLGQLNPNNIMLSGPHGGGKSCLMKSIAYAANLGQSFGIAPAKEARMSVFDKILSSVNTKENMRAGTSNFMSEKFRMEEILNDLAELNDDQKALVIIDEPFKGTMEDEGSVRAYNAGLKIAEFKNAICMMATHFRKPVELEKDTQAFKNYHFEIIEDDNKFTRTYNLLNGSCEWWYNDPNKRSRYIDFALAIPTIN